jgi:hypothetical protein
VLSIPDDLRRRPFHRSEALAAGITPRVLEGVRFVRIHQGVYRHRDHVMSFDDSLAAARLALPGHAYPTGVTRLQLLGLDVGSRSPLRFVVQGDLHLALEGVFLHRTVKLPPVDDVGVTPAAAFVAYAHRATTIDVIAVGDWLIHRGYVDADELRALVTAEEWRDGAREVAWILEHLTPDARSLPESRVRAMSAFAGLPGPAPNGTIELGDITLHGDLWYPAYSFVVEYEGEQHQRERGQYLSDIDRYTLYRRHRLGYLQATRELVRVPRSLVRRVHEGLVEGGYDGPPPDFGPTWEMLFARLAHVVPRRRRFRSVS